MNLSAVEAVVESALGRVFPAAQLEVRLRGEPVLSQAWGWADPDEQQHPVDPATRFDLASVTKLFVVTAFMTLVEQQKAGLDQPVASVLPEFAGERPIRPYEDPLQPGAFVSVSDAGGVVDAGSVTFRHLLTHASGLPAWRPLWQQPDADAGRAMALATHFSYRPGEHTVYSDVGLILLGMAIERLTGQRLDAAVRRRVSDPLGLSQTDYFPFHGRAPLGPPREAMSPAFGPAPVAPTESCAWRKRRIIGEVHDENAASLGGVAGHAGLFSNASDVAAFGESFLEATLLSTTTIAEMTSVQVQEGAVRRGLGFALWSPDPEASGNAFSPSAYGHTGFTGTSLWIDPERRLVVACLTNRVYFGRDAGGILAFRVAVHRAIVDAVA